MIFGPQATPTDRVLRRFARIEDVAADWLARREAGLTVDEQAEFSRWQLTDPLHAGAVKTIASTWRLLQKPHFTGQAGDVAHTIEARVERQALRSRRRALAAVSAGALAAAAVLVVALFPSKPPPGTLVSRPLEKTPMGITVRGNRSSGGWRSGRRLRKERTGRLGGHEARDDVSEL